MECRRIDWYALSKKVGIDWQEESSCIERDVEKENGCDSNMLYVIGILLL